jgi:hypothetical protein
MDVVSRFEQLKRFYSTPPIEGGREAAWRLAFALASREHFVAQPPFNLPQCEFRAWATGSATPTSGGSRSGNPRSQTAFDRYGREALKRGLISDTV